MSRPAGRVLVVEDDPFIGQLLMVLLERAGLDGVLRTDGRGGLAAVAALGPDLLVLDVGLPGLSGWEVLELVRAGDAGHRLPVLLLSAHSGDDERGRGLRMGADDFVVKPFDNADLVARMCHLMPGRPSG